MASDGLLGFAFASESTILPNGLNTPSSGVRTSPAVSFEEAGNNKGDEEQEEEEDEEDEEDEEEEEEDEEDEEGEEE